ncbi:MAG: polysaccharide deacetylase family protein [Leptolyngbyaceae cyanobacterium SM1_1_3]|nr:polysaccharide deacetylase family protein [Leptolyngbyaceae cyanobacterium SM1_1_3]NJN02242.1 polysaccharide deacetylase family protein [Leptolyngbyaceae cyanobacterium RM1_1_2]
MTPQYRLVQQVARVFPGAIFYKPTATRAVALTIDDVPTPNEPGDASTQEILAAIAAYNRHLGSLERPAQATFFIISSHLNDEGKILQQMLQQGHEIANHGAADDLAASLAPSLFHYHLHTAHQQIATFADTPLRWYRPGRGLYTPAMLQTLRQIEGYEPRFALASMIPFDTFRFANDPQFTAWYVSQFVFPGAILVLHGGSAERAANTARVLKNLLPALSQQGYQAVTLSGLWDLV